MEYIWILQLLVTGEQVPNIILGILWHVVSWMSVVPDLNVLYSDEHVNCFQTTYCNKCLRYFVHHNKITPL